MPGQPTHLFFLSLVYDTRPMAKPPTLGENSSLPSTFLTLTGNRFETMVTRAIQNAYVTWVGSQHVRKFLSRIFNLVLSSLSKAKSKISAFSSMRFGLVDLGSTTRSCSTHQRNMT